MNYLEEYNLNEEISEFAIKINDDYSNRYAKACGIENYNSKYVNPTELATLSLKYFLEQFPIPEGSIHTAQEVEIFKKIKKTPKRSCTLKVSCGVRRGWDSNPRCPCRHASFQD